MRFFFFYQPLVNSHQTFSRAFRVDGFSLNRLIPIYFLLVGHLGLFDQSKVPFLHELEYFREILLVLDQNFESTNRELDVLERIGFLFLSIVLEVDSDQVGHNFLLLSAEQVEADIDRRRQLAALGSYDIDVAQNSLQVIILHPQDLS